MRFRQARGGLSWEGMITNVFWISSVRIAPPGRVARMQRVKLPSQSKQQNNQPLYPAVMCTPCQQRKSPGTLYFQGPYGGSGGSRTHVQEHFRKTFSERSRSLLFRAPLADAADLRFAIPWILLRYRELTQEVPALMTPGSQAAGDLRPTRGAELCSQCEVV